MRTVATYERPFVVEVGTKNYAISWATANYEMEWEFWGAYNSKEEALDAAHLLSGENEFVRVIEKTQFHEE